jgi:glycosyltransferase involved in cell wall biosynthesis
LLKILQLAHRLPWPPIDGGKKGILGFVDGYRCHPYVESHRLLCMCPLEEEDWASACRERGVSLRVQLMDIRNSAPRILANTVFSRVPFNMAKYRRPGFSRLLSEAIEAETPDVVHFDSLHTAGYASQVRASAPSALRVLRCHNAEYVILDRLASEDRNPLRRRVIALQAQRLKRYEADALEGFDQILAISEADAARFTALNSRIRDRMTIVPAGADVPTVLPHAPPGSSEPLRLLHIAAMDWLPNQSGLLWFVEKVLPLLDAAGLNYHLDIIGKGMPDKFFAMGSQRVTVHGFVADISSLTAAAHLAVVPLQVGGGMRVKILDYWALGIPVIATRIGAEGLHDSNVPIIELADDPMAFANSIRILGSDPERRDRMRVAAFEKVRQEYSWPALIDQLVQRYARLLNRPRVSGVYL